jgi:hypothetical protein
LIFTCGCNHFLAPALQQTTSSFVSLGHVSDNDRIRSYLRRAVELRRLAKRLKTDEGRRLLLVTAEEFAALAAAVAIAHQAHEDPLDTPSSPTLYDRLQ